jgi:hypothetical protein
MGLPAVRFSQLEGMRFGDRAEMRRWLDVVDPRVLPSRRHDRRQVNFEEAFLRLNGREPTGEEKRDALMIQDVVRGADLDPVLLVFLALGKYETLYRQGAQRIATAVDEAAYSRGDRRTPRARTRRARRDLGNDSETSRGS